MKSKPSQTTSRKKEHVEITVNKNVSYKTKSTGFENWEFVHNSLPEINYSQIDTSTYFLHKTLSFPFLISCMTGGYKDAIKINRQLAEVCEEKRIAFGVGSQRQAIENSDYHNSFSIARKAAPTIPIIGNIGAAEVAGLKSADKLEKLVNMIEANAFAVHLNPLQELLQPEGNKNFKGVLNGIELLVKKLSVPIIVKEIGSGISHSVAKKLLDVGVKYIDVAGAGGTSWAGVEILRDETNNWKNIFWDWGISTVDSLQQIAPLKKNYPSLQLISSGGISNGIEIAKSISMSADLVACARPIIKELMTSGKKGVLKLVDDFQQQLKGTMFLVGAVTIEELQRVLLKKIS